MVGRVDYSSVPSSVELENNGNAKKYTINRGGSSGLVISKPLCTLMAIGALLLAVLVGLLVFFFVPRCSVASPQALRERNNDGHISDINSMYSNNKVDEVDERLPRSLQPTHYRMQLIPYLNNLTTNGAVTITFNVEEATDKIIINAKELDIEKSSVKVRLVESGTSIKINSQDYIEGEKYEIVLDEKLKENEIYTLDIIFIGYLNNFLQGFYRSQYQDVTNQPTKYLASTQFSPTDARRAFPCFDEPSFKAKFSISIARPSNMSSISNMPLEKAPDMFVDKSGWFWDHYLETPKMSTYIVAFIVSDLQAYGSSDKLIKIWSRRSLIHQTRYAAELAPRVLHFLEDYFNIKFPLPKIDIVAVPDFGYSAMENWGLITFRESSLLFDEEESSVSNKRDIATILSHELGHQWFGNLVTPKWWNDLWLKEGFATYLQYLGVNYAEPEWRIPEEFILSETSRAFAMDSLESSRPISFEVKNSQQIRQTFDALSYAKGASIVRMMNHFLGEDTFKNGLINLLEEYKYDNADRENLFKALTEEAHKSGSLDKSMNVNEIMDTWTKQPGFPVITTIFDRSNKKLKLSQKRFFVTNKNKDESTWWVPISIISDANLDFTTTKPSVWLKNEPSITIDTNITNWYLLNVNQTGYFIVNYDENNWRLLTANIMQLPPLTRAQLISDSMELARANLLDYDIPLRMISHMAIHDQLIMYVPTTMAFNKLQFLNDILSSTPAFGLFQEFHSTIFKKAYSTVNNDRDYYSNDYLKQSIRKVVSEWSCKQTGSECAITAQYIFRNWMEKNATIPIPANVRHIIYCTAIRDGNEAEWNFAYNRYLYTQSVSEKNVLLDALGCTNKKWLLSRYLNLLIQNNSSIRIQDASRVFESVANNIAANTLAFDFLRMNWNELINHYGEGFNTISKMVQSLPKYMNTEYQLLELIRFRNDIKDNIGTASQAFDSSIAKVKGNVEWMKRNYDSVERWFSDHKSNYNLL